MPGTRSRARGTADTLGAVTLALGAEELLAERVVAAAVRAVRGADPAAGAGPDAVAGPDSEAGPDHGAGLGAEVVERYAAHLDPGTVAELTGPSLFADRRAVVVRGLEAAPAPVADALVSYTAAPQPDVALVLVHPGGQRGRATVDRLRKAGAQVVPCDSLRSYELVPFVVREVRAGGGRIEGRAAERLVDAVGNDLRALAAAVSQLIADTGAESLTEEVVGQYFDGRAEVNSFAVADAVLAGQSGYAMEQLRWALRAGVAPVLVTSALASGLRGLVRLAGAPRGLRDGDLARAVGVPPWKVKVLRGQLRGWTPDGLGAAIRAVAQADADVKGAADDPAYALEKAVLLVGRARRGA